MAVMGTKEKKGRSVMRKRLMNTKKSGTVGMRKKGKMKIMDGVERNLTNKSRGRRW